MVVARKPKSLQAGNLGDYQSYISAQARGFLGRQSKLDGDLYARVSWIHSYRLRVGSNPDVDNIAKPILDALEGVVFDEDRQVAKCLSQRVSNAPGTRPTISTRNQPATNVLNLLVTLIYGAAEDVLYVEVGQVDSQQLISFGPFE